MPDYIPDDLIGGHCEIVATLFQSTVLIFVADVDKMWRSDLSLGSPKLFSRNLGIVRVAVLVFLRGPFSAHHVPTPAPWLPCFYNTPLLSV